MSSDVSNVTSAPTPSVTSNGGVLPPPAANNSSADDLSTTTLQGLTADEIALYDRQIRLWGAQAQERIRSARILLISLRALGTEIAKNLTLAGINSLTIIDDGTITEEDAGAQYFIREEDVGKPRADSAIPRIQELNPRVKVQSGGSLNDLLTKDQTYYEPFDCVIACDHDFPTISMINTAARVANRPFYTAAIHGFYGYIFADLVSHEYVVEREKSNISTTIGAETITRAVVGVSNKKDNSGKTLEIVKKQEIYCPLILANSSPLPAVVLNNRRKLRSVPALLPCLRAVFDFQRAYNRLPNHTNNDIATFTALATTKSRELQLPPETLRAEFLRSFIQNLGAEIVPTAAFVGGRLSEDVINVLGKREQPIQNFALFDGDALDGRIYSLFSPPPEMTLDMNGMMGMVGMSNGMNDGIVDMAGMGNGMDMGLGMQQMPGFISLDPNMPGMDMTAIAANGGMMLDGMNGNGFVADQASIGGMQNISIHGAIGDAQNMNGAAGANGTGPTSGPGGEASADVGGPGSAN